MTTVRRSQAEISGVRGGGTGISGILNIYDNGSCIFAGGFGHFLLLFSFYSNGEKLLEVSQPKKAITCIHGIRFLSMTWVMIGHTYGFGAVVVSTFQKIVLSADHLRSRSLCFQGIWPLYRLFWVASGFKL